MVSLSTALGEEAHVLRDRAFQLLLLANLTSPLGPALVSPLLDSLMEPFGVTESEIGLMVAAYTAPGIVVIPIVGLLADRYGRKPVLLAGLVLFGLTGVAITLTTDFRVVLVLRVLQGIGGSGIVPVLITSIGDRYRGAEEATAQGLRLSTSGFTQAFFPAIAGFLVLVAWQYPLLLYGIALPIAVAIWLRLEEPKEWIEAGRRIEPGSGRDDRNHERPTGGRPNRVSIEEDSLVRLATRPAVMAVLIGRGFPGFCYFGFVTYNSIIVVRVLSGTPAQAGLLVALGSVTYAFSASQAGRVTAHFDSRAPPMVGMFGALGIGLGLIAAAPTVAVSGLGVIAIGAGFGILGGLYRSIVTGIAPGQLRGGLVSVSESIGRIGITLSPVIMGVAIALLRPAVGLPMAVRLTLVGLGVVGGLIGIATVLVGMVDPVPSGHTAA